MSSMAETATLSLSTDRHELELRAATELERLPGVLAAAAWLRPTGELRDTRIHIMPGVAPTIIANAAARVLHALSIPFEQKAIRTTHISLPEDMHSFALGDSAPRRLLLLQDIAINRVGPHVTCRVQLIRDDDVAAGEARELDTAAGRLRAAAIATLQAAENTTENLALGLEGATLIQLFGREYAAVSVEASIGRRAATLCGLVPMEPNRAPEEAACLATLRAIDRWMGL
jgi:hypothetical protein